MLRIIILLSLSALVLHAEITDTAYHAEPAPPTIQSFIGNRMIDSAHGSVIMRMTNSDDGQYCFNTSTDLPVINSDSSLVLIHCVSTGGVETTFVRLFYPQWFQIGNKYTLDLKGLDYTTLVWSRTNPLVLYGAEGGTICSLTIDNSSTSKYTTTKAVLVDITGTNPGRTIKGLRMSRDDARFAFYTDQDSPAASKVGAGVAYSDGTLRYYTEATGVMTGFTEAAISGDGSYAYLKTSTGGTLVNIGTLAITSGPSIGNSGSGSTAAAYDAVCLSTHLCGVQAPFSALSSTTALIDFGDGGPTGTRGVSIAESAGKALLSFCCTHPDSKAYENELLTVPLDGTGYPNAAGIVQRWAYTFSYPSSVTNATYQPYAYASNAVISEDGNWIVYSSTWGANDRIDMLMVPAQNKQFQISSIYGPGNLYKGHYTYAQLNTSWNYHSGGYVYFTSVTGLPPGVTLTWFCDQGPGVRQCYGVGNQEYSYATSSSYGVKLFPRFYADPSATPGTYPVTVTLTSGGVQAQTTFDLTVVAVPSLPAKPADSALTKQALPVSALNVWRGWMNDPGYRFCQNQWVINPFSEADIWYYDGGYGFFHASDLTGDTAKWDPCAYWVIDAWRDRLNSYGYVSVGHHTFVHGLYEAWLKTGDPTYADAIDVEANHTPEVAAGVSEANLDRAWTNNSVDHGWFDYGRPTFYHPQALVFWGKVGGTPTANDTTEIRPRLDIAVDRAMYMLDMELNQLTDPKIEWQTWIAGLATESLIDYYEYTYNDADGPDTRVLDLVKRFVDWCAAHRNADGTVTNNPQPKGPYCSNSSGGCLSYIPLGNAFVAGAAAWYWRQTGDDTYLDYADSFFVGMSKAIIDTSSKKQWAQLMRWTYDYYLWRTHGLGVPASSRGNMRTGGGTLR